MTVRATIEPLRPPAERRSRARKALRLPVSEGGMGELANNVLIHDLSPDGLLLESAKALQIDETLQVNLPRGATAEAVVVWSSNRFYGCRFLKPLPRAAMSASLLKAFPPTASPAAEDHPAATPIGAQIAALRQERGWTMDQLAAQLKVSRQAVWYWETGKRIPKQATLSRIERKLGATLGDNANHPVRSESAANDLSGYRLEIARHFGVLAKDVRILIEL